MATPTPKRTPVPSRYPPRPLDNTPEVVDPRWLLKAIGITIAVAAVLGYLTLCLLIYQGSWQFLLHPSPRVDRTPAAQSIPFEAVRFDAALTGHPRLTGWWIPSDPPTSSPDAPTLLFLHDGTGSLASNLDQLALLHRAHVNLFAIDYRGFGQSDPPHPTEARMSEDTAAALDYLVNTRHLAPQHILPYGVGLGAALAAALAQAHPELPALILDNPDPEAGLRPARETRTRLLPVRLLMRDRFDLAGPLQSLTRPKLLLIGGPGHSSSGHAASTPDAANAELSHTLPDPKMSVTLPQTDFDDAYLQEISRFLDRHLLAAPEASPPAVTIPAPASRKNP